MYIYQDENNISIKLTDVGHNQRAPGAPHLGHRLSLHTSQGFHLTLQGGASPQDSLQLLPEAPLLLKIFICEEMTLGKFLPRLKEVLASPLVAVHSQL